MRIRKQRDFFDKQSDFAPGRHTHGGQSEAPKRKLIRPLDRRRPVHLVLKSSHARGELSLLRPRNQIEIQAILRRWVGRFGIKIHNLELMSNHLHIVLSFSHREGFQDYLRTIAALIARHVTGARRGRAFGKRFWNDLAFTRIVFGRRDFRGLTGYMDENRIERESGSVARRIVEEFAAAEKLARRRRIDVWEILESPIKK